MQGKIIVIEKIFWFRFLSQSYKISIFATGNFKEKKYKSKYFLLFRNLVRIRGIKKEEYIKRTVKLLVIYFGQ